MENLEWTVEEDKFEQKVPIYKNKLQFANIIAKINPNSRRFLAMACHYDSKYTPDGKFEGATDSAVPCAQLINLATVMKEQLQQLKRNVCIFTWLKFTILIILLNFNQNH